MIKISRKSCRENLITNRSFDMHKKHSTIQLMPDDLKTVCHVLSDHHIKKALVLDNGNIVGIINASNITKYAFRKLEGL